MRPVIRMTNECTYPCVDVGNEVANRYYSHARSFALSDQLRVFTLHEAFAFSQNLFQVLIETAHEYDLKQIDRVVVVVRLQMDAFDFYGAGADRNTHTAQYAIEHTVGKGST